MLKNPPKGNNRSAFSKTILTESTPFLRMSDLSQGHQLGNKLESERPGPSNPKKSRTSVDNSWSCPKCTLINKKDAKVCEVCKASKPVEGNSANQPHCGSSKDKEDVQEQKKNQSPLEEALTRGLECPVCWVDMKDHIFQCKNGHLVCQTCWRKLKNCPVCRARYNKRVPIRCLFAEQMAENLGKN